MIYDKSSDHYSGFKYDTEDECQEVDYDEYFIILNFGGEHLRRYNDEDDARYEFENNPEAWQLRHIIRYGEFVDEDKLIEEKEEE